MIFLFICCHVCVCVCVLYSYEGTCVVYGLGQYTGMRKPMPEFHTKVSGFQETVRIRSTNFAVFCVFIC